jgi:hyperosmotically inducible periplasmic protein
MEHIMITFKFVRAPVAAFFLLGGLACNSPATAGPVADARGTGAAGSSAAVGGRQDTNSGSSAEPNNTGINKRDRSGESLTPGDQGGSDADREMTRRIRRAIVATKGLSTDAKNIKIITVNGKVTLRGPVANDQEQKTINDVVHKMGITTVNNQLELKPLKH